MSLVATLARRVGLLVPSARAKDAVDDSTLMVRALELAHRAEGRVSPRPPVGAVVVSPDGEIVGEGWTTPSPGPHAEVVALERAGDRARGATIVVTLEPCSHQSVTPPCADTIARSGIARVVAAVRDPDPRVLGRGFARLRAAGIDVRVGPGRSRARALIEPFTKWVTTGLPFVTLKLAASLDGKVAAPDGTSRWISGGAARAEVHDLRRRVDAILVGAGTVVADDPSLTYRGDLEATQPTRVVVDSSGRTADARNIFDGAAPTVVITTDEVDAAWSGADVVRVPRAERGVKVHAALEALAQRGICHVLCEGGPQLASTLVDEDFVDRYILYLAPIVIGGDAPGLFTDGVKTLADAWRLEIERVVRVGDDIRIDARRA